MAIVSVELAAQQRAEIADEIFLKRLADKYAKQLDKYYSRPQKLREKDRLQFSPSLSSKCSRELYYMQMGIAADEVEQIPWQARVPRNGTGVHEVSQRDMLEFPNAIEQPNFRVKMIGDKPAFEVYGDKTFIVEGIPVRIAGSCDAQLEYWESDKYQFDVLWEKKTLTRLNGLSDYSIGLKQESSHKYQAICYSLLFGIDIVLFEYEALEKPAWKAGAKGQDIKHLAIRVTAQMREYLLQKLAHIVHCIEAKKPPERELDKCMFCRFKTACREDD